MELESLQDQLAESVVQLRCEQLQEVCLQAKISTEKQTKKHTLIRLIIEAAEEAVENEEEEVASAFLVRLIKTAKELMKIDEQPQLSDDSTSNVEALATLQQQYAALQLSFQASTMKIEGDIMRLTNKMTSQEPSNPVLPPTTLFSATPPIASSSVTKPSEVTIRREFKISGQIGERGQKDKLSYSNLTHQIDMGLRKNHSEEEIVEAVVRAVSPGLTLRDMLEIKADLTLSQLRTILKGHYKEDSSTDLYHRLLNVTQESNESPQNFLFRAIELKERLLVKSRELGSDEHYSPELIQRKFLRALGTGLISDNIKYQLKAYLDDPAVTDEVLIAKISEAAVLEWERQQKFKKNYKEPKVREIHAETQSVPEATVGAVGGQERASSTFTKGKVNRTPPAMTHTESELLVVIKQLRGEVEEIKKVMSESPRSFAQQRTTRKRGCRNCQENNQGDNCDHCFKCGLSGHLSRGCRSGRRPTDKPGQVKKHQQAVVGFLESNRISFQEVDITMLEDQRMWMYRNIPQEKQPQKGNPLPPQIFNGDQYCGDYEDFFQSKENNTVFAFLGLRPQPSVKDSES